MELSSWQKFLKLSLRILVVNMSNPTMENHSFSSKLNPYLWKPPTSSFSILFNPKLFGREEKVSPPAAGGVEGVETMKEEAFLQLFYH